MSKFALFFSYTPQTWAKMITNPKDRTGAVRELASALGGSVEAFYYMFGERDGFVVLDLPDDTDAAAVALGVNSTGAFDSVQTHVLIEPANLSVVLGKAKTAIDHYTAPGS